MLQPSDADLKPNAASVGLGYIANRAGVAERSIAWIIAYVRLLQENDGFPPPIIRYNVSSRRRVDTITFASRWNRFAVDTWFDGLVPPELAAAGQDLQARRDAARLDARAQEMAA